jgi:hypothetical protein
MINSGATFSGDLAHRGFVHMCGPTDAMTANTTLGEAEGLIVCFAFPATTLPRFALKGLAVGGAGPGR